MCKICFVYLLVSLFCVLFSAVYESFAHGVYSNFMLYAFVFPLAGGALPYAWLSLHRRKRWPGAVARQLGHAGIATLTTGSMVTGALQIYGTTNRLTYVYWIAGGGLLAAAAVIHRLDRVKLRRRAIQRGESDTGSSFAALDGFSSRHRKQKP